MHHLAAHGSDGFVVVRHDGRGADARATTSTCGSSSWRCASAPAGATVVAGAGSNDTRHAVHMTERATELGADAILSVTPYYNRPNRRGIRRHYEEVARATDQPIVLYNIPSRTGDRHAQRPARRARPDRPRRRRQAGQQRQPRAGRRPRPLRRQRRRSSPRTLDIGRRGRHLRRQPHRRATQMRRMVDEPDRRAAIDDELARRSSRRWSSAPARCPIKAALNLLGHRVGGLRLPLVEADERRARGDPRGARAPRPAGRRPRALSGDAARPARSAGWARSART